MFVDRELVLSPYGFEDTTNHATVSRACPEEDEVAVTGRLGILKRPQFSSNTLRL